MNISEFANYAGVSKAAVSRYFNDGYLSQEKRDIIEKAIKETGYQPSFSAQAIKTRVTKLVGVILPKLSSESCAKVTEGISEIMDARGYQILLVNTANDYLKEIEYLDLFRQNRVDGVILLATVFTNKHKALMRKMHIPVVVIGQEYKGFNSVCHDDYGAAYALTTHMIEAGGKVPGYIGVLKEDKAVGQDRHAGFLQALADHGLDLPAGNMSIGEFTMDSGYRCGKELLASKNRPDFIFCPTDTIASGAMSACRDMGLVVPDDVMICGVGDSRLGRATVVPLTTARLHYKKAGMEAAKILLESVGKTNQAPKHLRLDYELIPRQSTMGRSKA